MSPRRRRAAFLAATTVSYSGDWLTTYALGVVLYRQTGNVAAPALYVAVRALPRLAGPFLGGFLADHRGALRSASRLALGQGAATVVILAGAALGAPWLILAAVAASQVAGSAMRPVYSAAVAGIAGDERGVARLTAWLSASFAVTVLVAPSAGVLLLGPLGATALIALDAGSFAVAATVFAALARGGSASRAARPALGGVLTAGVAFAARDPVLATLLAVWGASALVVACMQSVLVAAVVDRTGTPDATGLLYAAIGVGGLAGCGLSLCRSGGVGRGVIVASFLAEVVPLGAAAAAPDLWTLVALLALSSLGAVGYQVWGAAEVVRRTPAGMLGRVNGAVYALMACGAVAGATLGTLGVGVLGWRATVLCACALATAAVVGTVAATSAHPARRVAAAAPDAREWRRG